MTLDRFIELNRSTLDAAIARAVSMDSNPYPTDEERRLWVLNDQALYNWAMAEGVDLFE